jgi:hypothetical protein
MTKVDLAAAKARFAARRLDRVAQVEYVTAAAQAYLAGEITPPGFTSALARVTIAVIESAKQAPTA